MLRSAFVITLLLSSIFGCTLARAAAVTAVDLTIDDRTARFLAFYHAAQGVNADRRWQLWKQMYDFAAVPPTPEGDALARRMLDQAWPRYPAVLARIRLGAGTLAPPPTEELTGVAVLLDAQKAVRAKLIVFVGEFDGNTFTAPSKQGVPAVAIPIEVPDASLKLTHEFTHVVEAEVGGISLDWERSIAQTIFVEGLAMRAVQRLEPGGTDASYTEFRPGWFAECSARRDAILRDLQPHLQNEDPASVARYTMGQGGAGVEREAYFAGWLVVGDLLQRGWTFPKLARLDAAAMKALVAEEIGFLMR